MKLNKKGFTLVELLVTIVIVGLVLGLSTFGIISLVNNSKGKTNILSIANIKEAAKIYSTEASSESWNSANSNYDAFCVTVGELINKDLLDKNALINDGYTKDSFVIVKRNKVTLAIDATDMVTENINDGDNKVCTNQNLEEESFVKPVIGTSISYTDRIDIPFSIGSASSGIKNYTCLYGTSSSSINMEGVINGNTCILDGLKKNKEYYVLIYMNTNRGSSIIVDGNRNYKTKDFSDTTFSVMQNTITINYNNKNISGDGYYYFKSDVNSASSINVEKCTMNNNIFDCSGSNNVIEAEIWYRTIDSNVKLVYDSYEGAVNIESKICDKSNNCHDDSKKVNLNRYTVRFYKNNASTIDGSTSNYVEKSCLAFEGYACSITSPSIVSKIGHNALGWNTSSSATSSSWNVGTSKNITSDMEYYAIILPNKVNIKYSVNGGVIATTSNNSGKWESTDAGIVLLNGNDDIHVIGYGESLNSSGLNNYNNPNYLNISRTGYSAKSGEEWKCLSDNCNRDTYNHDYVYNSTDFCDASKGDCTVVIGVNWIDNVGPTFGDIEVTNITSSGYDICINDVEDPSGIAKVQFPTWTVSNWQDDLLKNWMNDSAASGTNEGGGTWCYRVNVTDHNNESGYYNTHIYMYDTLGNSSSVAKNNINVPASSTPVDDTRFTVDGSNQITVYHFNSVDASNVYTYDKVNGLSNSGSFTGTFLTKAELIKKGILDNRYLTNELNCYYGASTASGVYKTFPLCYDLNGDGLMTNNEISVWKTTASGWYYSKTYDCFVKSSNLSTSKTTTCYGN